MKSNNESTDTSDPTRHRIVAHHFPDGSALYREETTDGSRREGAWIEVADDRGLVRVEP